MNEESLDPANVWALMNMPSSKTERELQSFLCIVSYLSKFSPMTVEVSEPHQRLTFVIGEWICNRTYQEIYKRVK